MLKRKVLYRLYPTERQIILLLETLGYHCRIYNTALEERIRVYREEGKSLSFYGQCKVLTSWRNIDPGLKAINAQSLQVTLKRLDLAFQAFFRRIKAGEKPGFPRFKALQRFKGWGYKTHGDGFRIISNENMQHGQLRLSGIGLIKMRGKARTTGNIKTAKIIYKAGKWYVSVTIECQPKRASGTKAIGMDWGLEKFLVTHDNHGKTDIISNPRFLKKQLPKLKTIQQSISRKKKGSSNRKKAVLTLAKLSAKIARQRRHFHHALSAKIVKENALIATESLSVKAMTAKGGNRKKGLNREILSTAPTQFHSLLKSKAEEAGILWIEIPTRKVKPTQTCYRCKAQAKKALSERWHDCECGVSCDRDENSTRVILNWALDWASGQELAKVWSHSGFMALKHETPTIPA